MTSLLAAATESCCMPGMLPLSYPETPLAKAITFGIAALVLLTGLALGYLIARKRRNG
ncbi:MAG TPA: hypothetical protein VIM58_07000 [Candidatus Methylacidiphilales bacterium]